MFKVVFFLYLICFTCYVIFSREPDFLEADTTTGTIIKQNNNWLVQYNVGAETLTANAAYPLRALKENESVRVIYNPGNSVSAGIYNVWGYWLKWNELLISFIIVIIGYFIAASVTNNPTPEALIEELESNAIKPRKPRYDI